MHVFRLVCMDADVLLVWTEIDLLHLFVYLFIVKRFDVDIKDIISSLMLQLAA